MRFSDYRIVYSEQTEKYKVQKKEFWCLWSDHEERLNGDQRIDKICHEFETLEEAKAHLKNDCRAVDWKKV